MRGSAVFQAVRHVFRDRRGTAFSLVGLSLGVAVAAAPWIAIDSSLRGIMDSLLEDFPIDMTAIGPEGQLLGALDAAERVEGVRDAEPLIMSPGGMLNATGLTLPPEERHVLAFFVEPSFAAVLPRTGWTWTAPPEAGGIVVDASLEARGVPKGSTVFLEIQSRDPNGTVVGTRQSSYVVVGFARARGSAGPGSAAFLAMEDLGRYRADLNVTEPWFSGWILVWLDRGTLFDTYDPDGSSARFNRQVVLVQNALYPHGFAVSPDHSITYALESISGGTTVLRLVFFLFAIPTLAIAGLLARVGFEAGLTRQRRELSVLRARGLSLLGVRAFLLAQTSLLAVLGGLAGLGIGLALSRTIPLPPIAGRAVAASALGVSPLTVLLSIGFAWLLALAVSWRTIRLLAEEDLVAGLKAYHAAEVSIPHKASRDFLLGAVGAAGLLLLLAAGSLRDATPSIVTFLLGFSTAILAPFAPVLLTFAVVSYLTRGTTRAYRLLSHAFRRLLGELEPLVERNLARAPRRASNIALLSTFAVGFAVTVLVIAASAQAYGVEDVLRTTPSDVVLEVRYEGGDAPFNASNRARVEAVPGAAAVTPVIEAVVVGSTHVMLFDASAYARSVPWVTARHLGGIDPDALLAALDRGDSFAGDTAFAAATGLRVGDEVRWTDVFGGNVTARLTAIVPGLPGVEPASAFRLGGGIAYVDLSALPPEANLSWASQGRYLVAIEPGADPWKVADAVGAVFGNRYGVRTQAAALEAVGRDPFATMVFGFLETQSHIGIGLMVVGVGMLVYASAAERRDELATIVARGASRRVVARLVMAEGWVVSVLGIALGVAAGLVTAATLLALGSILTPTPIPFVVPTPILIPLLAMLAGIWVAGVLASLTIQRMDVARVLKLRGG